MKSFELKIPTPCNESWEGMSPDMEGKFCGVCSKTVVDFTNWEPQAIADYLLQNANQKTCGRFYQDQIVDTTYVAATTLLPQINSWKAPTFHKWAAIIVCSFFLANVSVSDQGIGINSVIAQTVKNQPQKVNHHKPEPAKKVIEQRPQIMGDTVMVDTVTPKPRPTIMGKIAPPKPKKDTVINAPSHNNIKK